MWFNPARTTTTYVEPVLKLYVPNVVIVSFAPGPVAERSGFLPASADVFSEQELEASCGDPVAEFMVARCSDLVEEAAEASVGEELAFPSPTV